MHKPTVLMLVVLAALAAACGSSDTCDQMEGIWLDPASGLYVHYGEDGQFSVAGDAEATEVGEWGDYTCDGENVTIDNAAESSYCPDTSATWTVEFSDDGDEASTTFVEDSCVGSPRSRDMILLRQSS